MSEIVKCYYDRLPGTVDGLFSIVIYDDAHPHGRYLVEKHPARSGAPGSENTDWISGHSPVPEMDLWLWIDAPVINPGGWLPSTPGGIGKFYQLSSGTDDRRIIRNPKNPSQYREDIGMHFENAYRGSNGCEVNRWDSPAREASCMAIIAFLDRMAAKGFKRLPYRVT